jgi:glutathione-regulated potassium-efflux system ancillary protein KefC/glutathione-regulated potassium-efflux system protein KefB
MTKRSDQQIALGRCPARAIVIALEDINASVRMAEMLKETFPNLKIFARALNRQHEIALREIGVHYVIRDTLLSSLELTRNLFTSLGLDAAAVDTFKTHDELTLQKQAAVAHDPQAYKQTTVDASAELKSLFNADQATRPVEPS